MRVQCTGTMRIRCSTGRWVQNSGKHDKWAYAKPVKLNSKMPQKPQNDISENRKKKERECVFVFVDSCPYAVVKSKISSVRIYCTHKCKTKKNSILFSLNFTKPKFMLDSLGVSVSLVKSNDSDFLAFTGDFFRINSVAKHSYYVFVICKNIVIVNRKLLGWLGRIPILVKNHNQCVHRFFRFSFKNNRLSSFLCQFFLSSCHSLLCMRF